MAHWPHGAKASSGGFGPARAIPVIDLVSVSLFFRRGKYRYRPSDGVSMAWHWISALRWEGGEEPSTSTLAVGEGPTSVDGAVNKAETRGISA